MTQRSLTFRDYFLFRRRPRLRGISPDWQPPSDEDEYQRLLEYEGFVSKRDLEDRAANQLPVILADLKDLDTHLLPTFFEMSQKSKYYQNQYYLYQYIFYFGAFLTIILGAITLFGSYNLTNLTATGSDITRTQEAFSNNPFLAFAYLAAITAVITAFFTALSNRGEPFRRWWRWRRLAEDLRSHYFLYLSHLPPYDYPDRVQRLRETVVDIRMNERENV